MRIIIPMAGSGQRFLDAGYAEPKPLIRIDGKPMIEHVVELFSGETDFFFICSSLHLRRFPLRELLGSIAPKGRVFEIPPHKKGPVYSVSLIADQVDDEEEVVVNYCDFSKSWSYPDFLKQARESRADGAVSAYRGFHPHMLGRSNYAFLRCEDRWLLEIREKQPFTDSPMQEYASDGTYYFRRGATMKKYFHDLMEKNIHVQGEYYASMAYNLMRDAGLRSRVYEIRRMLQWGTPEDMEEYQRWSDYFRHAREPQKGIDPRPGSINLIAMAGRGNRFRDGGYTDPKPLIKVDGRPMVLQAVKHLPAAEKNIFVCQSRHLDSYPLEREIIKACPDSKIVRIDPPTQGQACSCEKGLEEEDPSAPLFIAACDNAVRWDADRYRALIDDEDIHGVVWAFRRRLAAARNPEMYGWLRVDQDDRVLEVSVKKPVSSRPCEDYAVAGAFYFREASYFTEALQRLYDKGIRINGEYYVDSVVDEMIKSGHKVKAFAVEDYISWGTPDDLKTFEYWREHFSECL